MKRKKKIFGPNVLINTIKSNTTNTWLPTGKCNFKHIDIGKFNDICEWKFTGKKVNNTFIFEHDLIQSYDYQCKKVNLLLTNNQRKIIDNWLYGYKSVYNYTVKYIKDN